MKRRAALFATFGSFCQPSCTALFSIGLAAHVPPARANPAASAFSPEIKRLFDLPDARIDVGLAALTLAQEIYPSLDVKAYDARIDALVHGARLHMEGKPSRTHIDILLALNAYMFQIWGMRYDHSADARSRQDNYFLNGILDTRKGMCLTMPLIYLAVARRLGHPIYPVMAPQHTFLRYVLVGRSPHNIEVTSGGGVLTDEQYVQKFGVSRRGMESGAYLRTLSLKEYLGTILLQNALVLYPRGQRRKALAYFEKANELSPRDPVYLKYLGTYWNNEAHGAHVKGLPDLAEKCFHKSQAYHRSADELGFSKGPYIGEKG